MACNFQNITAVIAKQCKWQKVTIAAFFTSPSDSTAHTIIHKCTPGQRLSSERSIINYDCLVHIVNHCTSTHYTKVLLKSQVSTLLLSVQKKLMVKWSQVNNDSTLFAHCTKIHLRLTATSDQNNSIYKLSTLTQVTDIVKTSVIAHSELMRLS